MINTCIKRSNFISKYLLNSPMIIMLTINIPIPKNTLIIELILCLTTSVSLLAFSFGYFKLMIRPIEPVKRIIATANVISKIKYGKDTLKFIVKIIKEININGNSIRKLVSIFDLNIFL